MLTQVRGALKGAVAWFVIVLLILAFALWGVPSISQFSATAAISVGDEQYSQQYVQREFTRAMQSRRAETGETMTTEEAVAAGLHEEVISTITTTSAIDQLAEKMRLAMPREMVRDFLQENENFHNPTTGRFDSTILQMILQQNGLTLDEFERRVTEDLKRNQLLTAIAGGTPAADPLVDALLLRQTEQRRIRYLVVTDEMAGRAEEPTPDDLKTFYEANPADFTAPEYRVFDLLVLRNENFRERAEAPEEEIRRIYDLNKERVYDKPETRTIYQITFDTEAEAQAAAATLRQGRPFEQIASDRGRSLDSVTFTDAQKRDILDPAVADAAFADGLEEGAILDPVQSLFGWTVVQIAGVTPAQESTFEEKREEIEAQYLDQDVRRSLLDAIDAVETERDSGAELEAAAAAAGYDVQSIGPVDRYSFAPGGAIIDKIPGEALAEAFALDEGEESESLELAARDGYFFVSLREIVPPALKPFDDVRDQVEARWRDAERAKRISAAIRGVRETIEKGETLEAAAEPFNRAPTEKIIDRGFTDEAISAAFNDQVFSAAPGELVSGPAGLGEGQIIAEIVDVGFAVGRIPPDQVELFKQYVGYQIDQELVDAFLTSVRNDTGVKVNQSQLDAIFGGDL